MMRLQWISTAINVQQLCVFDDDGFDYICGVFAFIGNDFHYLVNLSFLDHLFCIRFGFK